MYDYNASHLNYQATLLEEFHKIQRYLIEHPLYQIYQSSADYVAGVNEYYINEVAVREGGTLSVGDVVLFSNVYYGVITEINEETEMFTIAEGISFRGATGETGPRGGVGPRGLPGADGNNALEYLGTVIQFEYDGDEFDEALTFNNSDFNRTPTVGDGFLFMYHLNESNLSYIVNGRVTAVGTDTCQVTISPEARQEVTGPTGAQGVQGEMGAEGLSIYLYDGELSSSVASVTLSQINIPSGRTLKVGDILFSSLASTYGAMSIVTGTTGTVDFIGTLTGGSGGGVSDVQINGTTIVADGVANITNMVTTNTGPQNISLEKRFYDLRVGRSGYSNSMRIRQIDDTHSSFAPSSTNATVIYYIFHGLANGTTETSRCCAIYAGTTCGIRWRSNQSGNIFSLNMHPNDTSRSANVTSYLPSYGGTLMSTGSRSTGTSGSVTLPSAGLYELKVVISGYTYTHIVNFDATNSSMTNKFINGDLTTEYVIVIDSTGLMTVTDITNKTADTSLTISYRKIGIA